MRRRRFLAAQQSAHRAAKIEPILHAVAARLVQPDNDDAHELDALRRQNVDGLLFLAFKAGELRCSRHESARLRIDLARKRRELPAIFGKHDDGAVGGRILRGKGDGGLIAHG
jgi:hypothetical protein